MTIEEQRIFVCEKLLGIDTLPTLTLDWLHSCWLKLTLDQKKIYLRNLSNDLACSFVDYLNIYDLVQLEDATPSQRLAALVQTISNRTEK